MCMYDLKGTVVQVYRDMLDYDEARYDEWVQMKRGLKKEIIPEEEDPNFVPKAVQRCFSAMRDWQACLQGLLRTDTGRSSVK
jgi:hypothetical protein